MQVSNSHDFFEVDGKSETNEQVGNWWADRQQEGGQIDRCGQVPDIGWTGGRRSGRTGGWMDEWTDNTVTYVQREKGVI